MIADEMLTSKIQKHGEVEYSEIFWDDFSKKLNWVGIFFSCSVTTFFLRVK